MSPNRGSKNVRNAKRAPFSDKSNSIMSKDASASKIKPGRRNRAPLGVTASKPKPHAKLRLNVDNNSVANSQRSKRRQEARQKAKHKTLNESSEKSFVKLYRCKELENLLEPKNGALQSNAAHSSTNENSSYEFSLSTNVFYSKSSQEKKSNDALKDRQTPSELKPKRAQTELNFWNENSGKEHTPVYQQNNEVKDTSNGEDPFEFISYSPSKKKGRRRPLLPTAAARKTKGKANQENKPVQDSDLKNKGKAVTKVKTDTKTSKCVNNVNERVVPLTNNIVVETNKIASDLRNDAVQIPKVSTVNKDDNVKRPISDSDSDAFHGFRSEEVTNDILKISPVSSQGTKPTGPKNLGSQKFTSLTSTPLSNNLPENHPPRQNGKIKVLSNIALSPPRNPGPVIPVIGEKTPTKDSSFFGFSGDSSPEKSPSPRAKRQIRPRSWRGDRLSVTRNPHWLAVKDSWLPCYNQEMVLEPKLLEKPMGSATPAHVEEPPKRKVQTSILDFINSDKQSPKRPNNTSLFDYEDFSPIKTSEHAKTPTSANILTSADEVENCFGFDMRNTENEDENVRVLQRKKTRAKEATPQNLTANASNDAVEKEMYVGLFEDLEDPRETHRQYEIKRRKRTRLPSTESEPEQEEIPKRKRKDFRSQAEEEEFTKWAATFNAMCDEVNQHELVTE